jgi:hypothetical protein
LAVFLYREQQTEHQKLAICKILDTSNLQCPSKALALNFPSTKPISSWSVISKESGQSRRLECSQSRLKSRPITKRNVITLRSPPMKWSRYMQKQVSKAAIAKDCLRQPPTICRFIKKDKAVTPTALKDIFTSVTNAQNKTPF